jgi:hypothetical protein
MIPLFGSLGKASKGLTHRGGSLKHKGTAPGSMGRKMMHISGPPPEESHLNQLSRESSQTLKNTIKASTKALVSYQPANKSLQIYRARTTSLALYQPALAAPSRIHSVAVMNNQDIDVSSQKEKVQDIIKEGGVKLPEVRKILTEQLYVNQLNLTNKLKRLKALISHTDHRDPGRKPLIDSLQLLIESPQKNMAFIEEVLEKIEDLPDAQVNFSAEMTKKYEKIKEHTFDACLLFMAAMIADYAVGNLTEEKATLDETKQRLKAKAEENKNEMQEHIRDLDDEEKKGVKQVEQAVQKRPELANNAEIQKLLEESFAAIAQTPSELVETLRESVAVIDEANIEIAHSEFMNKLNGSQTIRHSLLVAFTSLTATLLSRNPLVSGAFNAVVFGLHSDHVTFGDVDSAIKRSKAKPEQTVDNEFYQAMFLDRLRHITSLGVSETCGYLLSSFMFSKVLGSKAVATPLKFAVLLGVAAQQALIGDKVSPALTKKELETKLSHAFEKDSTLAQKRKEDVRTLQEGMKSQYEKLESTIATYGKKDVESGAEKLQGKWKTAYSTKRIFEEAIQKSRLHALYYHRPSLYYHRPSLW